MKANVLILTSSGGHVRVRPASVPNVDTNHGFHGTRSRQFYTRFSLLKSIEGGFGLPCLNHACDASPARCPTFSER